MQRRNLFRLAAAGCAALSVPTLRAAQSKSIVIIYSRTGSTEQLARWIAEETKSDYLKLELVEPYAESYGAMTNIAREERASGKRREIKTTIPDLSAYDTIWLGSPYWWGGYSVPMLTFLKDHPLEGKRVLPFCTSGSSSPDGAWSDLRKLAPKAKIEEGFWVPGGDVGSSREELLAWVRKHR